MKVKKESEKAGLKLSIQKTKIMESGPITSWQIDGENVEAVADFIFLGSKITADSDCSPEIKNAPWKESYDKHRQHIKKQSHNLADKCQYSQSYGFSRSHVWMWELNQKEGWGQFFPTGLEKTLGSPLDYKEIRPVNPKENQPWIFTRRTDPEAETPILWPRDVKS